MKGSMAMMPFHFVFIVQQIHSVVSHIPMQPYIFYGLPVVLALENAWLCERALSACSRECPDRFFLLVASVRKADASSIVFAR